jgi:hypothetical protein
MDRNEPVGSGAPDFGRPDRPLGRGLEDVSHVFLSQRADEGIVDPVPARRPERPERPERPFARERAGSGAVLLRPTAQVSREQVAAVLKEFEGAIEAGLTGIDAGIPCAPHGEIDFLAVDRASQLTIMDFETTANDDLLMRGLGHFDWVVRNIPNLRRMFRGQAINFALQPRVVLLAPQFSVRMRSVARQITRPNIYCVRYHFVETPGRAGILFEPVSSE